MYQNPKSNYNYDYKVFAGASRPPTVLTFYLIIIYII